MAAGTCWADTEPRPLLDYGFLDDDHDVRKLVHGIVVARAVAAAKPFTNVLHSEVLPGVGATDEASLRASVMPSLP